MLIVTDSGNEMVNTEQVFAYSVLPTEKGFAVVAFAPVGGQLQLRTFLAQGSKERCAEALKHVQKGLRERWHVLDLLDLMGSPPNLEVPSLVLPGNGQPPSGS
jgi:hypothetical protein